jgi:hypothetical protein
MTAVGHPSTAPGARSSWRSVALPSEHGGWALTAEPVVLGLLVAPSVAGLCLGVATMVVFLAHTPLRVVLVDRHRRRHLDRTALARRLLLVELAAVAALAAGAAITATAPFWWPALAAAPLLGIALWFDTRSRSRRLAPELAGTIGIASAAAMILLAGGHPADEAIGAWLVLGARAITSIPHVRARIAALHHRAPTSTAPTADLVALLAAGTAVVVTTSALLGALSVVAVVGIQRRTAHHEAPPKVIGVTQLLLGTGVVVATALGFHLT